MISLFLNINLSFTKNFSDSAICMSKMVSAFFCGLYDGYRLIVGFFGGITFVINDGIAVVNQVDQFIWSIYHLFL